MPAQQNKSPGGLPAVPGRDLNTNAAFQLNGGMVLTPAQPALHSSTNPPRTGRPDVALLDLKEDGSFPPQACDS